MLGAPKRGFRSMAGLILVRNVAGELRPKRTLAASRGFLAAARLSCCLCKNYVNADAQFADVNIGGRDAYGNFRPPFL